MSDRIDKIAVPLVGDEPDGYREWLGDVKARVHAAQQRAAMAVNQELLSFYWQLGRDILDRQDREGWGAKVVDRLARDLKIEFRRPKAFLQEISSTCVGLRKPGPIPELCSSCCTKCPGSTCAPCSTR